MKCVVHRGTHEIGGSCIELVAQDGKKIWIDLGMPLSCKNPDTLYAQQRGVDGLLISHSHQDHWGLMEHVDRQIPIYIGQVTLDLINATRIFLEKPQWDRSFKKIEPWKWMTAANSFRVKPYLMDHSSPEAFAFLIEADGKRVLYSGDFRATGRKKILYEKLIKTPPRNIDLLLVEGTMIGRGNGKYASEEEVEFAITKIIQAQHNITFVISSAQNVDRFVSVVKACQAAKKQVIVDVYNAWVLDMVKKKSPGLPTVDWNEVKVYNHPEQLKKISGPLFDNFRERIARKEIGNEIFTNPAEYVYFLRNPNSALVEKMKARGKINLIYSQWQGYLQKEHKTYFTDSINRLKNDPAVNYYEIHTSGHADISVLKDLTLAINPLRIVPIHTENPGMFKIELEKDGMKNAEEWEDGQVYDI